ncbi:MAG: hypothetical protein AAFZ14_00055 [Pseudomonadota bacterium]
MTEYTLMPGKPFEGTEEETLQTIRAVLTEELKAEPQPRKGALAAKAFMDRTVSVANSPRRRAADLPELRDTPPPAPKPRALARLSGHLERLSRRVRRFRPTTRHLAIVSTLLLMVVRPHWFIIGGLVALILVVALFMIFGAPRIWGVVLRAVERAERKDADRGARLRHRLDRFAFGWDGLLDRLPDGMADDLYMPDFQNLNRDKVAELDRVVSDRLNRMADGA